MGWVATRLPAIVWDGQALQGLQCLRLVTRSLEPGYFSRKYGVNNRSLANAPKRGVDTITIPGVVAGWAALHERFGKLPFEDLMAPAIEIAERGTAVPPVVAQKWAAAVPDLKDQPGRTGFHAKWSCALGWGALRVSGGG